MPSRERLSHFKRQAKEGAKEAASRVARPKKFEQFSQGIERIEQVVALCFLGPVIVINLVGIQVMNNLMADVLLTGSGAASFNDIFAFLVTFATLGMVIMSGWAWFQFVRTAGFGMFRLQ